jgi:hypothetical protein
MPRRVCGCGCGCPAASACSAASRPARRCEVGARHPTLVSSLLVSLPGADSHARAAADAGCGTRNHVSRDRVLCYLRNRTIRVFGTGVNENRDTAHTLAVYVLPSVRATLVC